MLKITGSCDKSKYAFKIHAYDVSDAVYLMSKLPKRVTSISRHAKKRFKEKGFRTSVKELNSLMLYRNLLDVQVTHDGDVTFVFRASANCLFDIAFVVNRKGHVLTVWCNAKNDTHQTLDESIYRRDVDITTIL